jgi:hypothetical protein
MINQEHKEVMPPHYRLQYSLKKENLAEKKQKAPSCWPEAFRTEESILRWQIATSTDSTSTLCYVHCTGWIADVGET